MVMSGINFLRGEIMDKPHQCNEMKAMRGQLRTASPEGRNQIAKRISKHYQSCEQCAEWWDWVWKGSGAALENNQDANSAMQSVPTPNEDRVI